LTVTNPHKPRVVDNKRNRSVRFPPANVLKEVRNTGDIERQEARKDYKLHVVMDKESFIALRWLKTKLDALSEAEVVRRALKAYELFAPEDEDINFTAKVSERSVAGQVAPQNVEHLYVRIPTRMKMRLDIEQQASGRTYSEQVRQALRVLTELVTQVEAYKNGLCTSRNLEEGNNDTGITCVKVASVF